MNTNIVKREYARLRAAGWHAKQALFQAKTLDEFKTMEHQGLVRLRIVADEDVCMEDLKGDCYDPRVNSDVPRAKLEREEREFEQRVSDLGVWGVIGEYFDGEDWQRADSCFGFVGDDWKDSGYDADIMRATMDEAHKVERCPTCGRPLHE